MDQQNRPHDSFFAAKVALRSELNVRLFAGFSYLWRKYTTFFWLAKGFIKNISFSQGLLLVFAWRVEDYSLSLRQIFKMRKKLLATAMICFVMMSAQAQTYGYDDYVRMPTMDLYDPGVMNMAEP